MEKATFTLDEASQKKLAQLATKNMRSMSAQLRWMIERDFDRAFNDSESQHAPGEPLMLVAPAGER